MQVACVTTSFILSGSGQQQQQQRQVSVDEMVDSRRHHTPGMTHSGCLVPSPADCSVTRHEYVGRSSTSPYHTGTQLTPSSPGRPPPHPPPPTTYKHLSPPRLDVDVAAACLESTARRVNSDVDVRDTNAELPGTNVSGRSTTRRKSLSLPTSK